MGRESPFKHNREGRAWFHRGYMCYLKQKDRTIRCIYQMKRCNLWMPREFIWQNSSRADCSNYIDLLAVKRIADARVIEDRGCVLDLIYDNSATADAPFVSITPLRLLALLRGEEVLEIPLDARIRLRPEAKHYTMNDIDAAIFSDVMNEEYMRKLRQMVGEGKPIMVLSSPDEDVLMKKYGFRLCDDKLHSGANLDIAREAVGMNAETPGEVSAAPAPVNETEVTNLNHGTHTETVSLITGNAATPYFVRRLLRGQHLLWSGTSYEADGPWTEYHRDEARLTALGITIA